MTKRPTTKILYHFFRSMPRYDMRWVEDGGQRATTLCPSSNYEITRCALLLLIS